MKDGSPLRRVRKRCWLCCVIGPLFLLLCSPGWAALDVKVAGADDPLARNIRNHIGTVEESALQNRRRLQNRLQRAVRDASEALGYYHATFTYSVRKDRLRLLGLASNLSITPWAAAW